MLSRCISSQIKPMRLKFKRLLIQGIITDICVQILQSMITKYLTKHETNFLNKFRFFDSLTHRYRMLQAIMGCIMILLCWCLLF